jgi:hypothetical protein
VSDLFASTHVRPMEFVLPLCPSTNNLFFNTPDKMRAAAARNGKRLPGRLPSAEYDAWKLDCAWRVLVAVRAMPLKRIESPWYDLQITIGVKARIDVDNVKAIADLFHLTCKVTPNDSKMWRVDSTRSKAQEPGMMRVRLLERWAEE